MYSFEFDEKSGIMRIRVVGAWTLEAIETYRREATAHFAKARQKAGHLRLLIDNMQGELLQQNLVQPMLEAGMSNGRRDDRVAMVVASSLIKLQTRRIFGEQNWSIFISDDAARIWLTAQHEPARATASA